jgi:hypothetical protein
MPLGSRRFQQEIFCSTTPCGLQTRSGESGSTRQFSSRILTAAPTGSALIPNDLYCPGRPGSSGARYCPRLSPCTIPRTGPFPRPNHAVARVPDHPDTSSIDMDNIDIAMQSLAKREYTRTTSDWQSSIRRLSARIRCSNRRPWWPATGVRLS